MQAVFGTTPIFVRFAANGLAFASVLLLLLTLPATVYLLVRRKERATRWLAAFMVCIDLALITMFLVNSIVLFGWALNPLQDVFVCLGGIALLRFAYCFPTLTRPRAANVLTLFLGLLTAAGLVYALTYAARGFALGAQFSGEFPPLAPTFYLLTPLAIAVLVGAFIARAVETARADAPGEARFAGRRGVLRVLASPPNPASCAHRNFALAVSLGIVQAAASYAAASLDSALAIVGIALGALLVLAAILLVYLNYASEPHSLVVRLVGITLVCVLAVMTLVGHTAITVQARQLEVFNSFLLQLSAVGDIAPLREDPGSNVLLIQSWDADAARAGQAGEPTIKHVHDEVASAGLPGRLKPPTPSSGAPTEPWSTMHPLILPGPPPRLVQAYYFEARGRLYVVVTAGQIYVRAVHTLNVSLMLTALLGAAALIVLVPLFVRSGLIAPLQQLVAGIRRADQGDLRTPVPVQYDDEIGFVTRSFNRTIASVQTTQQALLEANERQEAVVAQRTAQLAAALDAAEESKRAAEDSEQAAHAANEAKSGFLAGISHELRTPLTAILGYSDLLSLEETLTVAQRKAVRTIQSSADHLLKIVDDVLELRRVETGRLEVHNAPFHPALLAAQMDEMFRRDAEVKGLALTVAVEPGTDAEVIGDQHRVRQIAVNLIGNAIKFTEEGEVRVTVQTCAAPEPDGAGRRLVLTVQDTGPGIPPASAEAIWEPFQRVRPDALAPGVGLGLPISRKFAHLLGGELTMQSTGIPGHGATFRLEIPVQPALPSAPAAPSPPGGTKETLPAQEARVLVVDDSAENRELLMRVLGSYGVAVQCAGSGDEAIRVCIAWHPHLIFMDILMPGMDGHSATQQIHALCSAQYPDGDGPKVVALTAHAFVEQQRQLLQEGFHDLVRKPYRRRDIGAALERHLGVALPAAEPDGALLEEAAGSAAPNSEPASVAQAPAPPAPTLPPNESDLAQRLERLIHDVRNSLTTIGLWAEMALDLDSEDGATPGAYREHLERIERKSRTIEKQLNDVDAQLKRAERRSAP